MQRPVRALTGLVVVASALAAGACGSSGRDLREPVAGATAPPRKTSPTQATAAAAGSGSLAAPRNAAGLNFSTPAWEPGETIPERYTCDGEDVSPAMVWAGAPAGTTELAIVVDDTNADGFIHYLVAGIPAATTEVAVGAVPTGGQALRNSAGGTGWTGPCPPSGTHSYNFVLLAFTSPPQVDWSGEPAAVASQLRAAASARAVFIGSYSRR